MASPEEETLELMPSVLSAGDFPEVSVDFEFGAATHVGLCRAENQDHYAVVRRTRSRKILLTNVKTAGLTLPVDDSYVLIVADGIGGSKHGEVASELILRIGWDLASMEPAWFMKFRSGIWPELKEHVAEFAHRMQRELQSHADADPRLEGMGTTWTCVYAMGKDGLIAQVGDSRAYRYRNGALEQLTRDHTFARQLEDIGVPSEKTAPFQHMLTNAFAANNSEVEIDVNHLSLADGDRLLLCSDGLHGMVEEADIAATLAAQSAPQAACDRLIEQALAHGGKDNVTVVIADVHISRA
jgi:protein phosphatase